MNAQGSSTSSGNLLAPPSGSMTKVKSVSAAAEQRGRKSFAAMMNTFQSESGKIAQEALKFLDEAELVEEDAPQNFSAPELDRELENFEVHLEDGSSRSLKVSTSWTLGTLRDRMLEVLSIE